MKRWVFLLMALSLAVALAGCSGGGRNGPVETIELTTNNMAFESKELTLQKGKAYRLLLKNSDSVEHDFSVDKIPVKGLKEGHGDHGDGRKVALHVHAGAGKTESVEFTPTEAGTYTFYCTVLGHKDAGMVGQVVVK